MESGKNSENQDFVVLLENVPNEFTHEILLYFVQPFFHIMAPGAMLGDRNHSAGHDQIQDGPGELYSCHFSEAIGVLSQMKHQFHAKPAVKTFTFSVFPNFPIYMGQARYKQQIYSKIIS